MSVTHAIIRTSGRQYRIKSGDTILVDRIAVATGDSFPLTDVILLEKDDGGIKTDGNGVNIQATVLEHLRGKKIRVFKMRRRKASRRTNGHRQNLTRLAVEFTQAN